MISLLYTEIASLVQITLLKESVGEYNRENHQAVDFFLNQHKTIFPVFTTLTYLVKVQMVAVKTIENIV